MTEFFQEGMRLEHWPELPKPEERIIRFRKVEAGFWDGQAITGLRADVAFDRERLFKLARRQGKAVLCGENEAGEKTVLALELGSFRHAVMKAERGGEIIKLAAHDVFENEVTVVLPSEEFVWIKTLSDSYTEKRGFGSVGDISQEEEIITDWQFEYSKDSRELSLVSSRSGQRLTYGEVNRAFLRMLVSEAREEPKLTGKKEIRVSQFVFWDREQKKWRVRNIYLDVKAFDLLKKVAGWLPKREAPETEEGVILPGKVREFLEEEDKRIHRLQVLALLGITGLCLVGTQAPKIKGLIIMAENLHLSDVLWILRYKKDVLSQWFEVGDGYFQHHFPVLVPTLEIGAAMSAFTAAVKIWKRRQRNKSL